MKELQLVEQQLQMLLMQKQQFELEQNELLNALAELATTSEAYKSLGGIMIKTDVKKLKVELEERKKTNALRIQSIEKQQALMEKKDDELKKELASVKTAKSEK
ncbi:MAG TPA: prefoldin subunit [Candidatus Nanoarchaeia archaeon]|nr:prefoldin subunit [Candidatus Nanoarchaeia archaeon]